MFFTVLFDSEVDHLGVPVWSKRFPSANRVEVMHSEPSGVELRVTYCHAKEPCPNACQCNAVELPAKAAENLLWAWPDQIDEIMKDIRPCVGGFWGFNRCGIFVGVGPDGYIHT